MSDKAGGYFYDSCQENKRRRKAGITVQMPPKEPVGPLGLRKRGTQPHPDFTHHHHREQVSEAAHTLSFVMECRGERKQWQASLEFCPLLLPERESPDGITDQ